MRKAIETPLVAGYGRDDSNDPGGINLIPGKWEPPSSPTPEELAAARLWMQVYAKETATVSPKDLEKWIAALVGNMRLSGASGEDDVSLRIKMLGVAVDERAAKHFSKDALKLAWAKFGDFIPTASQLMAFFDDLESLERTQAQRLMAVLDAGTKSPPPKAPAVDVDESMRRHREKQDRERQELAAIVQERFPPPPSPWERLPGESENAYIDRIGDQRRKMQDRITRQMRSGGKVVKREAAPAPTPAQVRNAYAETGIDPDAWKRRPATEETTS